MVASRFRRTTGACQALLALHIRRSSLPRCVCVFFVVERVLIGWAPSLCMISVRFISAVVVVARHVSARFSFSDYEAPRATAANLRAGR